MNVLPGGSLGTDINSCQLALEHLGVPMRELDGLGISAKAAGPMSPAWKTHVVLGS